MIEMAHAKWIESDNTWEYKIDWDAIFIPTQDANYTGYYIYTNADYNTRTDPYEKCAWCGRNVIPEKPVKQCPHCGGAM